MTAVLGDLDRMNECLTGFGLSTASSKTQARRALQEVYINIYDLVDKRWEQKKQNLAELRARCKEIGCFPKKKAKQSTLLKLFLRKMF
jgi:hypothetical protein